MCAAHACHAGALSADEYLALKSSLHTIDMTLAAVRNDPSGYIGKVLELSGTVNGTAKSSDSSSFILNCNGESLLIGGSDLPPCIMNGNSVRVLVEVGPGSVVSLSDLKFQGAASEYAVSRKEKELASKPLKKQSDKLSSRLKRGTKLSSRAMKIYEPYKKAIAKFNPRLTDKEVEQIARSILAYSEYYNIDPRLIVALVIAESGFRIEATSPKGAMGLGQLMPGTARGLGVTNAYDPNENLEAAIRLMRGHLDRYGHLALALAAYNAGSGAVKKYKGVPPYRETQNYVRKVIMLYNALCRR